jgi:hypothetical protein
VAVRVVAVVMVVGSGVVRVVVFVVGAVGGGKLATVAAVVMVVVVVIGVVRPVHVGLLAHGRSHLSGSGAACRAGLFPVSPAIMCV